MRLVTGKTRCLALALISMALAVISGTTKRLLSPHQALKIEWTIGKADFSGNLDDVSNNLRDASDYL